MRKKLKFINFYLLFQTLILLCLYYSKKEKSSDYISSMSPSNFFKKLFLLSACIYNLY